MPYKKKSTKRPVVSQAAKIKAAMVILGVTKVAKKKATKKRRY